MVLRSRNLVIDTQYFVSKSFDFNSKEINALKDLVEKSLVNVFLTDINNREIQKKITDVTQTAFAKISTSDTRILKQIPLYGQFLRTYDLEKISQYFYVAFEKFKTDCRVNLISSDDVKAIRIFEDYCHGRAPFNSDQQKNRKGEFPDAFALAAIDKYFEIRDDKAYLLSGDSDWQQFANTSYVLPFGGDDLRFDSLSELSGFLDLVLRNHEATNNLSTFADQLIDDNINQISDFVIQLLGVAEFKILALDHEVSLSRQAAKSVAMTSKEIIEVSEHGATYSISFEAEMVLQYQVADYGNSTTMPKNREYFYLAYEPELRLNKIQFHTEVDVSYKGSIPGNFQIVAGEIHSVIDIVFEEGIKLDPLEWIKSLPVIVVGVDKGIVTDTGLGYQNFKNFNDAKSVFPDLDILTSSKTFTAPMGNKMTGELRFETWKASSFYSD